MPKSDLGELAQVSPDQIRKNPHNPRRYFNEEHLDLLRSSIQESGVLVPLIVYRSEEDANVFILMDGERRWRSALELGVRNVPVNIIPRPSPLQNLLRMFNIHAVREDWPLISLALSLREVMRASGEKGEKRLAEMTGLSRSAVRRAKRLLSLPDKELRLIQEEAHLDRADQVHREDLYLEIEAAESVISNNFPEIKKEYPRDQIIRQFARKREEGSLVSVTDFRSVGKLVRAAKDSQVSRRSIVGSVRRLIDDVELNPKDVFDAVASDAYHQQALARRAELLTYALQSLDEAVELSEDLVSKLQHLQDELRRVLGDK